METIYFVLFCLAIGSIIFWSFRNDDQATFRGQKQKKKFSLGREEEVNEPTRRPDN